MRLTRKKMNATVKRKTMSSITIKRKRKEFDILYYGLFFADVIEIFKINSNEIADCPGYSDKQHRGNKGEGQFHLNQDNLAYHRKEHQVPYPSTRKWHPR